MIYCNIVKAPSLTEVEKLLESRVKGKEGEGVRGNKKTLEDDALFDTCSSGVRGTVLESTVSYPLMELQLAVDDVIISCSGWMDGSGSRSLSVAYDDRRWTAVYVDNAMYPCLILSSKLM